MTAAHPALRQSSALPDIVHEFNRIAVAERSNKLDSWLLKVLHTTRALDTSLSEVLAHKGWSAKTPSLGFYIAVLATHKVLTTKQRDDFQKAIVNKRNRYMHRAGAMPNKMDANSILNEMHTCLSIVLSNT
ncbi:hypothetical protein [Nocardia amamiensis]|uniref:hypothetical protein n=1 Tax=Nocardia amamiensis TaxID=404578 RepID=UPI0033D3B936